MGSRPGNYCSAGHPGRHQFPRGFPGVRRRSVHRSMGDEDPISTPVAASKGKTGLTER
jgi:hypothetical protein